MRYSLLLLLAVIVCPATGRAQAERVDQRFFTLNWENDRWADTDRHYTNGNRIGFLSSESDVPDWLRAYASYLPFIDSHDRLRYSLAFGQNMFTPENITARALQPHDRPYAGWLYLEGGLRVEHAHYTDHISLSLGVVGESALAEPVQEVVHDVTDSPDPSGWDNQLKDEPALLLSYERTWPALLRHHPTRGVQMDISPRLGGSLGNVFTQIAAGATMRMGFNLDAHDGYPPRIRPSMSGSDYFTPSDGLSSYLFVGMEGRGVARNIFLDGNTYKNSHQVDREPFVLSAQLGAALTYHAMQLSYAHVFMKEEFRQQTGDTQFGVITLSYAF
ncbi:MAG: lipid A deacylase LpxR family protein [Sphaerospermopsis sp. SIO1G2]|nr:lipid A deacylase LpxR family protein [Sphaerospermopsis sp. SIO1G2]